MTKFLGSSGVTRLVSAIKTWARGEDDKSVRLYKPVGSYPTANHGLLTTSGAVTTTSTTSYFMYSDMIDIPASLRGNAKPYYFATWNSSESGVTGSYLMVAYYNSSGGFVSAGLTFADAKAKAGAWKLLPTVPTNAYKMRVCIPVSNSYTATSQCGLWWLSPWVATELLKAVT